MDFMVESYAVAGADAWQKMILKGAFSNIGVKKRVKRDCLRLGLIFTDFRVQPGHHVRQTHEFDATDYLRCCAATLREAALKKHEVS